MPWTNYHSHTYLCDGADIPEDYIEHAIAKGMKAYGISSHAPIGFKTNWCMPNDKLTEYIELVNTVKSKFAHKIETYLGLEIDYIPGIAGRNQGILKDVNLDYFIGSIHFVDAFEDGTYWNIDHTPEEFEKGLLKIFNGDFKNAATRFYEITREMVVEDAPDIIGHLDKIKMYNNNSKYFFENASWYKEQIEKTLHIIKKSGAIVEINTRGYYKYNQLDLYPSFWIVQKLAQMDIPVMLNSDSHHPSEIIAGFEYAAEQLKKAGIKRLWAFIENEWKAYKYNSTGIIF